MWKHGGEKDTLCLPDRTSGAVQGGMGGQWGGWGERHPLGFRGSLCSGCDGFCPHTASLAALPTRHAELACPPDVSAEIRLKRENDFIVVVFWWLLLPGPVRLHLSQATQRR